jgi:multidrug efflux pump subunit AcrB
MEIQDTSMYVSAEYEPEKSSVSIDNDISEITNLIMNKDGIEFVRSESRKGTAEFEIGFDGNIIKRKFLAENLAELSPYIRNGFFYVPEAGANDRTRVHEIQVAAIGDDILQCRETAKRGASEINFMPNTVQTVLNFKGPEKTIIFSPNRDILTQSNISVYDIAYTLRWILFGPVVDKWIQSGSETDIRVVGRDFKNTNFARLSNLYIPSSSGVIRIDALGLFKQVDGNGKIYRQDGRRTAYFTVHYNSTSTNKAVGSIKNVLNGINTEKGYGFLLPRELELLNKHYLILFIAFIGSIICILLLLTALTENIVKSIIITSIIPVSCFFPFFIKFITGTPLEMGDIVGLVVISGLSVNNAIYIIESKKSTIYFRLREKIQSILVTSLTGMAGAIPLVIMTDGGFSGTLAVSILWGTTGSLITALFFFPAILTFCPDQFK